MAKKIKNSQPQLKIYLLKQIVKKKINLIASKRIFRFNIVIRWNKHKKNVLKFIFQYVLPLKREGFEHFGPGSEYTEFNITAAD